MRRITLAVGKGIGGAWVVYSLFLRMTKKQKN
jgi:hypothetical protein